MGGDKENLARGYPGNAKYTGVLVAIVTGGMALLASSFWEFCPSEDLVRRWHSCLDHGSSDGAKCTGTPTASVSGAMVLVVQSAQLCPTLCDPMDCSTSGFPVQHQLPKLAQTHVHRVRDAIQPSHPLLSPSPPALNLSQHQGLFK